MAQPQKKVIPLVTNTLMVEYQLEAIHNTPVDKAIEELIHEYLNLPELFGKSKPCIKKLKIVRNILVNFAVMQTQGYKLLVFPMGRRNFVKSRYLPDCYTPKLAVSVVSLMEKLGLICVHPSANQLIRIPNSFGGEGTCTIPQAVRLELLLDVEFPNAILRESVHRPKAEVVILKSEKITSIYSEDKINYTDSSNLGKEVAKIYRPSLVKINSFLVEHAITYSGDKPCNRTNVSYHRIFNNSSLNYGGRYFGHYIQTLPKTERHLISIDGQSISNVDYSGMHYELLRWRDGETTQKEVDPFTIDGYQEYRDEFKILSYSLLNASKSLCHPPEDLQLRLRTKGWDKSFTYFKKVLLDHCPLIAKHQGQGIGLELMNLESQIMTKAMELLIDAHKCGFVCMHDALLVPTGKTIGTHEVMTRAFNETVGFKPHIKTTHY